MPVLARAPSCNSPAIAETLPLQDTSHDHSDSVEVSMTSEVCVKHAVGHLYMLGYGPFSQRVLLTLEEKNVPCEKKLIDVSNKPQWPNLQRIRSTSRLTRPSRGSACRSSSTRAGSSTTSTAARRAATCSLVRRIEACSWPCQVAKAPGIEVCP